MSLRQIAMKIAWANLNTPYIWGGDDPIRGFDCSGLVVEVLMSVGLIEQDMTADALMNHFYRYDVGLAPYEGCLVFWGSGIRATHVEIAINELLSIGASGGGSSNTSIEEAIRKNAYVKVRPIDRRNDLMKIVDPFLGSD